MWRMQGPILHAYVFYFYDLYSKFGFFLRNSCFLRTFDQEVTCPFELFHTGVLLLFQYSKAAIELLLWARSNALSLMRYELLVSALKKCSIQLV